MSKITEIRLSGQTYTIEDPNAVHSLDGYWTSAQTENAITAATTALAEAVAEEMSGKTDVSAFTAYTSSTETALSGKLDTSVFETYSGATDTALGTKFAGATWNSTDKKIYFYDNASATGTALAYIDASDFVKDGFLQSVTIENKVVSGESIPCLVFIWNTDAGIQETDIPLSGIFDPTNYVDVSTFTAYTAATATALSGKQNTLTAGTGIDITNDVISVTGVPLTVEDTVTSGSSNPVKSSGIYNFVTGLTSTKQDTLVSGTNIKTINNASILGSGNISTLQAEVQGTTLIFS